MCVVWCIYTFCNWRTTRQCHYSVCGQSVPVGHYKVIRVAGSTKMFGVVLSALVSCVFVALINASVEVMHGNFSQNNHIQFLSIQNAIHQHMEQNARAPNIEFKLQPYLMQPMLKHHRRVRRSRDDDNISITTTTSTNSDTSSDSVFSPDELGWTNINEEVDMVIPMVLTHLQKVGLDHLDLPDLQESISVRPLFITYSAGLWLTNGQVFNLAGIRRIGDALMTYYDKSFICRFYLFIRSLDFDYDFLIKLIAIEGHGRVVGSLNDTVIYADLSINVEDLRLRLNDFRVVNFRNIHVQLSQRRFIQELTGVILSPITNLFRDRITTSISDGLKDQMQGVMDDFNNNDPLKLRTFAKQMLSGLMGHT